MSLIFGDPVEHIKMQQLPPIIKPQNKSSSTTAVSSNFIIYLCCCCGAESIRIKSHLFYSFLHSSLFSTIIRTIYIICKTTTMGQCGYVTFMLSNVFFGIYFTWALAPNFFIEYMYVLDFSYAGHYHSFVYIPKNAFDHSKQFTNINISVF